MSIRKDSLVGTVPSSAVADTFTVEISDPYVSSTQNVRLSFYVCGDADGNSSVDISDAVTLIAYIFGGGPAPTPVAAGDSDCSNSVDISDAVYLIAYIFSGGPAPCNGC